VLSLLTIMMWSTLELTKGVLGDLGIVSLIFLTIMFGSGMLTMVSGWDTWGCYDDDEEQVSTCVPRNGCCYYYYYFFY